MARTYSPDELAEMREHTGSPPTEPIIDPVERYKLAYAEYRAEVALGSERQRLFVTLNPAVAALSSSASKPLATAALALAAVASLVGLVLVWRSHGRYRQTRAVLLSIATELGCADDWQTTGGMREARGEPRFERVRVVSALYVLFVLYVLFDIVAIGVLR
jgi:hypothetical protein